jgi:hypothetical protein
MQRPLARGLLAGLVILAGPILANPIPVPYVGQIVFMPPGEATILMVPDGSGPPLTAARDAQGNLVNATIRVQFVDDFWNPVAGVPRDEVSLWFEWSTGPAKGCDMGNGHLGLFADGPTDGDGWATFSLPLEGGGWNAGPCWIWVNSGGPAMDPDFNVHPPLSLRVVSPDLDGDRVVDLVDIGLFAMDYLGGYALRSDLHADGVLNLLDIAIMVQHLGAVCDD